MSPAGAKHPDQLAIVADQLLLGSHPRGRGGGSCLCVSLQLRMALPACIRNSLMEEWMNFYFKMQLACFAFMGKLSVPLERCP